MLIRIIIFSAFLTALIASAADTGDDPAKLGRLFFTPGERASLDIIRQNSKAPDRIVRAEDAVVEDALETEEPKPATNPVMFKGFVSRSDGKNALWVNQSQTSEKVQQEEFVVGSLKKASGQVNITVTGSEIKNIVLKPGQIYDPRSDQVYNYKKDVPPPPLEEGEEESDNTIIDKISGQLNLGAIKNKASELANFFKPDAEESRAAAEKSR